MKKHAKQIAAVLLAVATLGMAGGVAATEQPAPRPQKISATGLVDKVIVRDFLFGAMPSAEVSITKEDGTRLVLNVCRKTTVINQSDYAVLKIKDLNDGVVVFAGFAIEEPNVGQNASVAAEVLVVMCEQSKEKIKYDVFNENGYSSDGSVKLSLTEQTEITDKKGRAVEIEDAAGMPLLVFFDKPERGAAN